MMVNELEVMISGNKAGVLRQGTDGSLSFQYLRDYRGVPLSSAMPLSTQIYKDKIIRPYLWGLLPEDPNTRKYVAAEAEVSYNNPFALLSFIGLDCPGAVQFYVSDTQITHEEHLIPINEGDIASRLARSRSNESSWIADNEHWSLGGQQNKFALRKNKNEWFICEGTAATTHILKSGVRELAHQALNEYICMRLAAECGIDTAQVEYVEFEGREGVEPAIVVERYDRLITKQHVVRLHQEDLCQALGCLPDNKYAMYGGPTSIDVIQLLMSTGSTAANNVARFLQMLFFNYLIAATDGHAKNYSLMLNVSGDHRLAPMYDVASIAPYIERAQWNIKPPKLAMSIGGENRVGHLTANHLHKFVEQCDLGKMGITGERCRELIMLYADLIPKKLSDIFDEIEDTQSALAARELRACMEEPIAISCKRSKERLLD